MRSPFLQTVYFEYYVKSVDETTQQKYKRTVEKKMCTTFGFLVFPVLCVLVSNANNLATPKRLKEISVVITAASGGDASGQHN